MAVSGVNRVAEGITGHILLDSRVPRNLCAWAYQGIEGFDSDLPLLQMIGSFYLEKLRPVGSREYDLSVLHKFILTGFGDPYHPANTIARQYFVDSGVCIG